MLHDLNSRVHYFVDCVGSVGEYTLAETIYRFNQLRPEVELVVRRQHSRECYASVHDGTADIAFVVQEQYFQNIVTTPLFQEQMLLMVSASSPLEGTVDPKALDPAREIVIPWSSDFMRWRQNSLNISRHPNVSLWKLALALPFLRKSDCWIVAPQTVTDQALQYCPDLKCLPLTNPLPGRTVYWIEEYGRHHENSEDLLKIFRQSMKNRQGIRLL